MNLLLKRLWKYRAWRTGHISLLLRQIYNRNRNANLHLSDSDHLILAANWLKTAQDNSNDGGVCGRYRLDRGWTSSYPETTGYIIPTLIALSSTLKSDDYLNRAEKCVKFLLSVQLHNGGFPGFEIEENSTTPSPFNTAQILHGLIAWHRHCGDDNSIEAATRAANWLIDNQDEDGAWRKYFYNDIAATYSTHLSCWLAEYGKHANNDSAIRAANKHVDWALQYCKPNGWITNSGFDNDQAKANTAYTHTIAYSVWGLLLNGILLNRNDAILAAEQASRRIARRCELSHSLPGILDDNWKPMGTFSCLTGNAQMALIWFKLNEIRPDIRLVNAAFKAIDEVKLAQVVVSPNPNLLGAIPGSDPISGPYISGMFPNWAAKFFIDAIIEKNRTLTELDNKLQSEARNLHPQDTPIEVSDVLTMTRRLKIGFLSSPASIKVQLMLECWGFADNADWFVIIEHRPKAKAIDRVLKAIKSDGVGPLIKRFSEKLNKTFKTHGAIEKQKSIQGIYDFCKTKRIKIIPVGRLEDPKSIDLINSENPDVLIHAGASIIRKPLIAIPRLGILNAHMGILPFYRGMNVTEWAYINNDPVGCSVHLIDAGIDTGRVLATKIVPTDGISNIQALRDAVDVQQIELLGDVLKHVINSGVLPSKSSSADASSDQYFAMHSDLRRLLARLLSRSR